MTKDSAYLLISHGSRDPRPRQEMGRLVQLVRQRLSAREAFGESDRGEQHQRATALLNKPRSPLVFAAALELAPQPLHAAIQHLADPMSQARLQRLQVLPLFLLPGVHMQEDIPREIAQAQRLLGEQVKIELRPYLGSFTGMSGLIAEQFSQLPPTQARILLAHGSRRTGGNQTVETLAAQVGAVPAYWSVAPSLSERLEAFVAAGHQQIAVLPYFLFAGSLTDAIAAQVEQWRAAFPSIRLYLGTPLGATDSLADLIVDGLTQ